MTASAHAPHPAYRLVRADDPTPVLLSSAHSGRACPDMNLMRTAISARDLRSLEDPHVDRLADAAVAAGADLIAAHYARAWIDLNRDETDIDCQMFAPPPSGNVTLSARAAAGLGLIPRIALGKPIYPRALPRATLDRRLDVAHRPFHAQLATMLAQARRRHGTAILLDCHSMPPLPRKTGQDYYDVVIGDRYGESAAPWLVEMVEASFRASGYRVGRNRPYAGGHIITHHGMPQGGIHALQIELDRSLYLDLATLDLAPGWERLASALARVVTDVRRILDRGADCIAAE